MDAVGGKIPSVLQPLLDDGQVDLYMEAMFLGPSGAVGTIDHRLNVVSEPATHTGHALSP